MPTAEKAVSPDVIRDEWLTRLNQLVGDVENWAVALDWAVRRIDKPLKDSVIGSYKAPGLLLQKEFTRVILDPIARTAPARKVSSIFI